MPSARRPTRAGAAEERAERLTTLSRLTRSIASEIDSDAAFRAIAEGLTAARPEMKVLYMSGYTDDAIVHHGVLDPGTALLQKPFTPDALTRRVGDLLSG